MSKGKKHEVWKENGFEDWGGYMAAKQAKLEKQFIKESSKEFKDASNLFEGIAIFVNGYTDPTADELKRLMMMHSGTYHHYMRPRATTHIIASNLPYSKIILYKKSQNPIPICKPQWITDSIRAGRLLNFQSYLLYSNCTDVQPQLQLTMNDEEKRKIQLNPENESSENIVQTAVSQRNRNDDIKGKLKMIDANVINIKARCTKDSEFLSEFYSNSRLHHISTMGATFKDYVNELRDKNDGRFPGLERLKNFQAPLRSTSLESDSEEEMSEMKKDEKSNGQNIVMHIDMDCFFVSVGLRKKPELKGLPVAVAHAKGNKRIVVADKNEEEYGSLSEIASCSYQARKAGVRNGMFLGQALKLCPNLKTIQYDFEGYKEVSYVLYDTVASYTLDIEAVSCDEMYADCTKILESLRLTPIEFASIIRAEIKQKTGCPVSTGFGNNKLLARLATKKAKPDGQFYLNVDSFKVHMNLINIRDLPGVGEMTAQKLNDINVRTCTELQAVPLVKLQNEFGKKTGELLYNMCRGLDNTKLNLEHVRKSVSAEVNYGIRFDNNGDAVDFLRKLSEEVCARLKRANAKGRCITLKLMIRAKEAPNETAKFMGHGLCEYMTRSKNCITPINDCAIITKEIISLWNQCQQKANDIRGIGIQISRLNILKDKSDSMDLLKFIDQNKYHPPSKINETPSKTKDQTKVVVSSLQHDGLASKSNLTNFQSSLKVGKMPAVQDIDVSVLVELPEDIRNEILNEYSRNKGERKRNDCTKEIANFIQGDLSARSNERVEEVSFSQIDPDFLAALTEDMRADVQMYCMARKRGHKLKMEKTFVFSKEPPNFNGHLVNRRTTLGREQKIGLFSRAKNGMRTVLKNTTNKNKKKRDTKLTLNHLEQCNADKIDDGVRSFKRFDIGEQIDRIDRFDRNKDKLITPSNDKTIAVNSTKYIDKHQEMLIGLVNHLFSLPIEQIKMQIQTWVARSNAVNEVDFLSLATFLSMLPEKKRIEDLHILLKTMHRCTTESESCIWHKTYRKTVKHVQQHMQIEYNSDLMIPSINCGSPECNTGNVV